MIYFKFICEFLLIGVVFIYICICRLFIEKFWSIVVGLLLSVFCGYVNNMVIVCFCKRGFDVFKKYGSFFDDYIKIKEKIVFVFIERGNFWLIWEILRNVIYLKFIYSMIW